MPHEPGESTRAPLGMAVVGAAGFLGRHVVAQARSRGHLVSCFERDNPPTRHGRLARGIRAADVVYWLASRCNPATAQAHPELAVAEREELGDFLVLLQALARVPRLVMASSGGAIYGNGAPPFSEGTPLAPIGAYGFSKREAEALLWSSRVPAVAARISNPYGPGQRPGTGQGVVAQWFDDILMGRTPVLIGPPGSARDYVYVEDVAEGLVRLGESDFTGSINLGSGHPTTLGELAAAIEAVTGCSIRPREVPARRFDVETAWLDIGRARRTFGWWPRTSLGEGLSKTWVHLLSPSRI